jgi:hypothetical protein
MATTVGLGLAKQVFQIHAPRLAGSLEHIERTAINSSLKTKEKIS